ncbi:MCE family protein [Tomitella fengzijianii]|uniref:MCE family protein n=1 Tax=Tomitella fengzijianii TaxID=2597660 RepID=A0A516X0C5_9ACTN|nr:MCE family protein [Tomitella fengzijianii]QDQ96549.1 MCE family protein [Tomitella fengzijianii]
MTIRRNPILTGVIGILMVVLLAVASFSFKSLPFIGAGPVYHAEFAEAAGLKEGNEVRVAGVKAGQVTGVELEGDKVLVAFRVTDTWVGDQSTASIQIKTLLGSKYLALDPRGSERADPDVTIPLSRTSSPYDVVQALSDAAESVGEIDSAQLAQSMQVLSEAFAKTPEHVQSALDGVTRLSETIASRDQEIRHLFDATKQTSQILADRNQEFEQILAHSADLLAEFNARRDAIHRLLVRTQDLSTQLRGLVADNEEQIGPALTQLQQVVDLLQKNQDNIDKALVQAPVFYRLFNNSLGNGRWWDTIVGNVVPPGLPDVPSPREPVRKLDGGGN